MKDKNSFILYKSFYAPISRLPDATLGKLFRAIFLYQIEGKKDVENDIQMPFDFFINQFKIDEDKYEEICLKRRESGRKGGESKSKQIKQKVANLANASKFSKCKQNKQMLANVAKGGYNDNDNDNVNDNDNEYENDNKNIESKDSYSAAEDKVDYVEIITFYNQSVKDSNISACARLTDKRKAAIRARLKEYGKEKIFEAITKAVNSSFCNGHNARNWKADFDFIFDVNKMARIIEGKYDDSYSIGNNDNDGNRNREIGEKVLGDIFAEIEEHRRTEGVAD